ncbi:uncharacterized protein LOC142983138 isoform X2 [Anticarsia gemmatalis]|uniref:uncharacterized protein LOC142983138 isoform X2 n=1 Tax=Anticarsia gemmatalis TaxID=129554 RepID=UPI003F7643BF
MNPLCPEPPPRQPIPKDGMGPRGAPDCYYTSRVLTSTFRYVRFVKKLREEEEEQRVAYLQKLKVIRDAQYNDFFAACDRKLKALLNVEEEENIRKFTVQAQAGAEAIFQDKKERLAYLLAKRKKEHEDRYKDTPLTKCSHVLPCIIKLRAKEAEEIQLYQMREKKMRKMAEQEMDKMWNEVIMKEADALAARMEYDVIDRLRRDKLCQKYSEDQLEQRRIQKEKDKELLRQEALWMKGLIDEADRKEEEKQRQLQEKNAKLRQDMEDMIKDRMETVAKRQADDQLIADTWNSLTGQGLDNIRKEEELRRRKQSDTNECNRQLIKMKNRIDTMRHDNVPMILAEGQRRQDEKDLERCLYEKYTRNLKIEICKATQQQAKEKAAMRLVENADQYLYDGQVLKQIDQLVKHKELTDAQARKLHQSDVVNQIRYNELLKKRAFEDAKNEEKKCQLAAKEYQEQINKMLCRPFFSDNVHPFMKQMASGLKMRPKCPCGPMPDYCADPPAPVRNK